MSKLLGNAIAAGANLTREANAWRNGMVSAIPIAKRRRFWQALVSALAVEAFLIGALLAGIGLHRPEPVPPVIPLTIEALTPPEPAQPPEPLMAAPPVKPMPPPQALAPAAKPLPRVTATPPAPIPATSRAPMPTAPVTESPQPSAQSAPAPETAAVAAAQPTVAASLSSPPAPVPVPPVASAPSVDPSPAYNARLTAAAQAAFEVPGSVASLNFKGRTRVRFKLRDGEVSGVTVVQPSGLGAMDRAAAKAVETARYPVPPAALQGKEVAYEIWVTHAPSS